MRTLFLFFILVTSLVRSQSLSEEIQTNSKEIDTNYLEDQFYLGITYNLLIDRPSDVSQYNLSRGIHLGYLRDIPLNKPRNIGLGVGLGYAYNLIYTNIQATESPSKMLYDIISVSDQKVIKTYYQFHSIDFIPIEFRWRTSTPTSFLFWRVYSGIKISYLFGSNYRLKTETSQSYLTSPDTQHYFDWKAYISFGRGSWNGFIQYGLTPLFKGKTTQNDIPIDMTLVNIGFIFYIL